MSKQKLQLTFYLCSSDAAIESVLAIEDTRNLLESIILLAEEVSPPRSKSSLFLTYFLISETIDLKRYLEIPLQRLTFRDNQLQSLPTLHTSSHF